MKSEIKVLRLQLELKIKMRRAVVVSLLYLVFDCDCSMIRKECPHEETHRSCSFYEEYTCWESERQASRVKIIPKRLLHCRAGCYCKKGLVRAYPQGPCLIAMNCRNQELLELLDKLPTAFQYFKR